MIEFTYDGAVKKLTAVEDCVLSFTLVGGGGGQGGRDRYLGSYGVNGDIIRGNVPLKKGDVVYCAVGSRGFPGTSGGWAAGGAGGWAMNGFSGGYGGHSGPANWSGSGGGGGGATVLWKNDATPIAGQVTYTTTKTTYTSSYNLSNFDPKYLTAPLAKSNGFFVRSVGSLDIMGPVNIPAQREFWVIKNGVVTYNGTKMPGDATLSYNPSKFISSAYYYNSSWPGGGDYITIYDFEEIVSTPQYNDNIIAIAAGGGGGGGGGNYSAGYISSRTPYGYTDSTGLNATRGAEGRSHQGDGGGAGGGGGGYKGGSGGVEGNGDAGGQAGSNGLSYVAKDVTVTQDGIGNYGLYGGNWSYDSYDSNWNGYAAFDSIQTNISVFSRLKNVLKYVTGATPTYYPRVPYCGGWAGLMNDIAVWSGELSTSPYTGSPSGAYSCSLTWRVYFPQSGSYHVEMQADNHGVLYIDDVAIVGTAGEHGAFQSIWSADYVVKAGWHTIRMDAENWGGPYGVAGRITYLKQVVVSESTGVTNYKSESTQLWSTLSEINPLTEPKYYPQYTWYYAGYAGGLLNSSYNLAINNEISNGVQTEYTWNVYFETSGTYTIDMTIDDYGIVRVDSDIVMDLSTPKQSNWNDINTRTFNVKAGYHVISVQSTNSGGPGGIAGRIKNSSGGVIWTTRSNYNINAIEVEEVTNSGEWRVVKEIKYRQNGQWVSVPQINIKSGNTWKKVYGNATPTYVSLTASLMNNTSGPMYPPYPPAPEPVDYGWY